MKYLENLSETDRHWLELITQCRTSGKSDFQWMQENNIKSPTFYYHVKQLRKKACKIPERAKVVHPTVQEVVPMFVDEPTISETIPSNSDVSVRIQVHGICVEITNTATREIIQNTIAALQCLC